MTDSSETASHGSTTSSTAGGPKAAAKAVLSIAGTLERQWPEKWVQFGFVLECAQLFALLISNVDWWPWGSMVRGVGVPLYFVLLPFWDRTYDVHVDYSGGVIFFWVITAVLVLIHVLAVVLLSSAVLRTGRQGVGLLVVLLHSVGSFLFLPALHWMLAFSVCDENGRLTAFSGKECWASDQLPLFVISIFSMVTLGVIHWSTSTLFFEDRPLSTNLKARGHTIADYWMMGLKIITAVLYHFMLPLGQRQAFAGLVAFGAFLVLCVFAATLPHYSQGVNVWYCAWLAALSYTGLLMCLKLELPGSYVSDPDKNWDCLVLCVGAVLSALFGGVLANWRVSRKCLAALDAVSRGSRSDIASASFPANLPVDENVRHRDVESVLVAEEHLFFQQVADAQKRERLQLQSEVWVGQGYIDAIHCPTDVEVATRVALHYVKRTGFSLPAAMLAFVLRIATKGLAKYPFEPCVELTFVTALTSYSSKNQMALHTSERISRRELDFTLQYRVHRRTMQVSQAMLIRDTSHKKVVQHASRMHKEAMVNISSFWKKLLADHIDVVQLASLAKIITDRRESGLKAFDLLLDDSVAPATLVRYAQFLEQVMMNSEAATQCRELVVEQLAQQQSRTNNTGGAAVSISSNLAMLQGGSRRRQVNVEGSRTISNLRYSMNTFFLVFVLVCAGLLIYGWFLGESRIHHVMKAHTSGQARINSQHAALMAGQYLREVSHHTFSAAAGNLTSNVSSSSSSSTALVDSSLERVEAARDKLRISAAGFQAVHNELTKGKFRMTGSLSISAYSSSIFEARTNDAHDTVSLWTLGDMFFSTLEEIINADARTLLQSQQSRNVAFIQAGALGSLALAYNRSITALEAEGEAILRDSGGIIIAFYVVTLAILAAIYGMLVYNFKKISGAKLATLNLFTLIPKAALEKLHVESNARVQGFEGPDATLEEMKRERGVTDDADEMANVIAQDENKDDANVVIAVTVAGGAGATAATKKLELDAAALQKEKNAAASGLSASEFASSATGAAAAAEAGSERSSQTSSHSSLDSLAGVVDTQSKFAALAKNADVADLGKQKHVENYETPYKIITASKDSATPTVAGKKGKKAGRGAETAASAAALAAKNAASEAALEQQAIAISKSGIMNSMNNAAREGAQQDGGDSAAATKESEERARALVVEIRRRHEQLLGVTLGLLVVLAVAALGVAASSSTAQVARSAASRRLGVLKSLATIVDDRTRIDYHARQFLLRRDSESYASYWIQIRSRESSAALERFQEFAPDRGDLGQLFLASDSAARTARMQQIALALACSTVTVPTSSSASSSIARGICAEAAHTSKWSSSDVKRDADDVSSTSIQGYANDLAAPPAVRLRKAFDLLSSSTYLRQLSRSVDLVSGVANAVAAASVPPTTDMRAVLALLAASAILGCILLLTARRTSHQSLRLNVLFLVAIAVALTGVAVAASRLENVGDHVPTEHRRANIVVGMGATLRELRKSVQLATSVIVSGDGDALVTFADHVEKRHAEQALFNMFENVGSKYLVPLTQALRNVQTIQRFLTIACRVGAVTWNLNLPSMIATARWNLTAEVDASRTVLAYPKQLFYTNDVDDLAAGAPAATREALAIGLISGDVVRSSFVDIINTLEVTSQQEHGSMEEFIAERLDNVDTWIRTVLGLCVAHLLLVVLGSVFILLVVFEVSSGKNESHQRNDTLFQRLTRQSRIALVIVGAVLTAVFIVQYTSSANGLGYTHVQNIASFRDFAVARSLVLVQQKDDASQFNLEWVRDTLDSITRSTDTLYFGAESERGTKFRFGQAKAVNDQLFGSNVDFFQRRFTCPSPAEVLGASSRPANQTFSRLLSLGYDLGVRRWVDDVRRASWPPILTSNTGGNGTASSDGRSASDASQTIEAMEIDVVEMLRLFDELNRLRDDGFNDSVKKDRVVFIVLVSLVIALILYEYVFVFRPMILHLVNEEEGTKLLLKMIPPEVRDAVPAIAEYLETGVILQDMKLQEINEAATELSTVPTITIDFKGTVLRFSKAAEDVFLWNRSEILGRNVKLLMPDNVALEHDRYLARYRRTGNRKIIGNATKVRAVRRDGTVFPAELQVRELREGRNTIFVGSIRNISVDVEFERATALSKAVSEAATVPIIVINSSGIIQRFNTAAEHTFKYGSEIIGQKVNLLMPNAESEVHDGYLESYARTGTKRVVDTQRGVNAKKSTGEIFPALICVREVATNEGPLFIGYVEDRTKHFHYQMATMVNDAISATSPVPLVTISDTGSVQSWSPAAASVFRLPAQDIIGRNIKIIMPEAVAAKHDGYLQQYAKTQRKKMIDSVVAAKARRREEDGTYTTIPVRLAVKELIQQGRPTTFVAFVQDMSRQVQLQTDYKISSSITDMSLNPIITISATGIIKSFSVSACATFGYTAEEAVGQNLKMLMPKTIADHHDEYLARYRETGVKSVIDSVRRLSGVRKDGRSIALEIRVVEVNVNNTTTFVGYARDVSLDFKMQEANSINDAVFQLAVVPVLYINAKGTILNCSDSTCEKFAFSKEDLVGQNINVLMPQTTAVKHDGYLNAYQERRIKYGLDVARERSTILYQERRIFAKTRDEHVFPAVVHVRDVNIPGMDQVFVGYIRDVTEDLQMTAQTTIAESIIETSSIPLIGIDRVGTIKLFSSAAEKDFLYKKSEVLGHNIKMLMPEEVAKNHDGYLRAYAKTGVKSVVDSKRQVFGKKKNGDLFHLELMIKELFHTDNTGREVNEFIGFARDLTQHYILLQANLINEVVSGLALVPILMISIRGIVLDFNHAAETEFGYMKEEVLNNNVKMLMPEDVAARHDGFLAKYKQTGIKSVIGNTTTVTARRRNGTTFPAEISVREVLKEGAESYYVGYLRDMTLQRQISVQYKVNEAIVNLSSTPLLVIDKIGTVATFSRSAENCFGFTADKVVGKNIKMLMPPEIADYHDGYLSSYLKTRVKRVIDTQRRVTGMRSNGERFPVDVTVKEIFDEDGEPMYVGYVRDASAEQMMTSLNAFTTCINSLCPVPIIAMTHDGTVTRFSVAAEQEFGWSSAEVVGKNVKMLQPEEVATRHDFYLAQYLRTRIKRVVDTTRQVSAKRRDGSFFQAIITVKQVDNPGVGQDLPPSFVGYLRNVEQDLAIAEASREGNAMLDLSPIPIISISLQGIITVANDAACETFRYKRSELLGQNIKILTPPEIAVQHDGFLKRYQETRVATVIGMVRHVRGMRKDGTFFQVEISVREVAVNGLDPNYIGYVRDVTKDHIMKESSEISEAITELSANPIIAMDHVGKILKFSLAAEELLGYTAAEVIGRNVKMLMPPEISSQHDGYLKRYAVTKKKTVVDNLRQVTARHKNGTALRVEIGVREICKAGSDSLFVGFLRGLDSEALKVSQNAEVNSLMLDLAPQAVMQIDHLGVVLRANSAAVEMFKLPSKAFIVGKNVYTLMPEAIAAQHPSYLERYLKTGVKTVVDTTRRVTGMEFASKREFPVEISVREIRETGKEFPTFLGYVRSVEQDLQLDFVRRTCEAALHLSRFALIVIDKVGTILLFSRVAEEWWGHKASDVKGRNIKMLMPENIAVQHDGFLDRYQKTRVKNVIDGVRQTSGKRIDGSTFGIELRIKELKFSATGLENVFVGYVRKLAF